MTKRLVITLALTGFVLAALAGQEAVAKPDPQPVRTPARPALAVIIMVDQMRADYVERFQADWTGGLKRLLTEGAWFRNAAYPYLTTVTCAGHATVSTGAFPHLHGIFQNAWYDRGERRVVTCTEDGDVKAVEYDGDVDAGGESSRRLLLPTFAEETRRQRGGRVVTMSLKPRSAIMLAGKGADAVTWLNDSLDGWETSTAYTASMVPAVKSFLDTNPIGADFGKTWTRLLPASRYLGPDAGPGESPPDGWTAEFPHPLTGENGRPDSSFQAQWERSPFADAYLARLAASLTESFELGQSERLDVLGVSFSTPDLVGHGFGPQSHEVQDIYAHLDRAIGGLLARLDTLVGRGRYVVALASDHGVSTLPEQSKQATGEEGGRLRATRVRDTVERAAQAAGVGRYVSRVYGNDVYFEAGAYEKLEAMPAARAMVIERLLAEPGIARVFTREELLEGARSQDAMLRAAALSYVPRLSGDMLLVLRPGWMFTASGTTHGTPNPYDQRVPVIFMGPGVKAGVYDDAVTPADVAPTLAALTGIELPRAEGRPLTGALTPGRP